MVIGLSGELGVHVMFHVEGAYSGEHESVMEVTFVLGQHQLVKGVILRLVRSKVSILGMLMM